MEKMRKTNFSVKINKQTKELYTIKVKDELTKNHRDIEQILSGVMPENKTDPLFSSRKHLYWQYHVLLRSTEIDELHLITQG